MCKRVEPHLVSEEEALLLLEKMARMTGSLTARTGWRGPSRGPREALVLRFQERIEFITR